MLDRRFLRFLAVGALNNLFGYCAYAFLLYLGLHYSLATFLATVVAVLFNFQTVGRLVFGRSEGSRLWRFLAVYGVLLLVNIGVLRLFSAAGFDMYLAGALLAPPVAVLGYLLNRAFVFGEAGSPVPAALERRR